jgi:hypothetical protein
MFRGGESRTRTVRRAAGSVFDVTGLSMLGDLPADETVARQGRPAAVPSRDEFRQLLREQIAEAARRRIRRSGRR